MEKGKIIKSVGSRYKVLLDSGRTIDCLLRGKLRVNEIRSTNPIAVGDNVEIELSGTSGTGIITALLDRKNYILRKASNLSKSSQIIAANIDQVILMLTIALPQTPLEFIDRFLITAEAYRIPARLVFNKTDLYGKEEMERLDQLVSIYTGIGYGCHRLSLRDGSGFDELKTVMKDKINLISGNSGVGKSTLLNLIDPAFNIRTEEISDFHKQGKHITTFPQMYRLPFGGFAIDTPGLRGFGIAGMEKNEIYHFFPEIFRKSKDCRFYNCLHLDEPECAVREAVEKEEINYLRYRSYLSIMGDDNAKYR